MIENFDTKKLVIIGLILLLIYINLNSYKCNQIEKMTSETKDTVRKLEDYYTSKTDENEKTLELICKIDNKKYILGTLNKSKINDGCEICAKTEYKDIFPILINYENVSKKNCYNDELIKCFNKDDIADCKTDSIKKCNTNKISSDNLEFVVLNVQAKNIDTSGNITEPSFCLKVKDQKEKSKLVSLSSVEIDVINKLTNVKEKRLLYYVCCNKNLGQLTDLDKIYLEQYTEKKDKIRFKIYFMVPDVEKGELKKKYLGFAEKNLCDNVKCKGTNCNNEFKFLNLYSDPKHLNILVFKPELVRFE